jgi:hypothetical protein
VSTSGFAAEAAATEVLFVSNFRFHRLGTGGAGVERQLDMLILDQDQPGTARASALRLEPKFVSALINLADLVGMDLQGAELLRKSMSVEPKKRGCYAFPRFVSGATNRPKRPAVLELCRS